MQFKRIAHSDFPMLEDFKKFALKGNMIELAVAVIIGAAFSGLVNSIVNDLFMPVIGLVTGGLDFSNIYWQMVGVRQPNLDAARKAGATLAYGHFITLFINFIIVSAVMFFVIKALTRLRLTKEADAAKAPSHTDAALDDIRAILQAKYGKAPADKKTGDAAKAAAKAKPAAAEKSGAAAAGVKAEISKITNSGAAKAAAAFFMGGEKSGGEKDKDAAAPRPAKPRKPAKKAAKTSKSAKK